jgi:hemerythrin-like domain-containing protein
MKAIQKIQDEHRSLAAVLHTLKQLARDAQDAHFEPAFDAMRAMIRYIDEYPERLHHPKEDDFLFPRLVTRHPAAKPLVEILQAEHAKGAQLIRDLERALVFFEDGKPIGAREFLEAVDRYAEFHWQHMRTEERELLPLAVAHLQEDDWKAIDAAFDTNVDPIAGMEERDFATRFTRIVNLTPAPLGLGEPKKSVSSA